MSLTTPPRNDGALRVTPVDTTAGRIAGARARYQQDGKVIASPARILVLLYARLLRDLDEAEQALLAGDNAHRPLMHAQEIVDALDLALDRDQWSGAEGLGAIYDHLTGELVGANVDRDVDAVRRCRRIVEPLHEAWDTAAVSLVQSP